jgi:hypothetical protein
VISTITKRGAKILLGIFLLALCVLAFTSSASAEFSESVNFSAETYDAIDVTRNSIIAGEPVDWTVFLVDELDLYRVKYQTPPIEIQESFLIGEDAFSATVTFSTQHVLGYEDVEHDLILPFTLENITIVNASFVVQEENMIRFRVPFIEESVTVVVTGQQLSYVVEHNSHSAKNSTTAFGTFTLTSQFGSVEEFFVSEDLDVTFTLVNVTPGSLVPTTLSLPFQIPEDEYLYFWKNVSGELRELPYELSQDRSRLTLFLQDGYLDEDGEVNGIIVDPLRLTPPLAVQVSESSPRMKQLSINNRDLRLELSAGEFDSFYVVNPTTIPNAPLRSDQLPYNLLKFNVTNVTDSITVNITLENITDDLVIRKFNARTLEWYSFPYEVIEEDMIQITFIDGGLGDDDGLVNGVIEDDLGLAYIDVERATLYAEENDAVLADITSYVTAEDNYSLTVNTSTYIGLELESVASELNAIYVVGQADSLTAVSLYTENNTLLEVQEISDLDTYTFSLSALGTITEDRFWLRANNTVNYDYITDPIPFTFIGNITQVLASEEIEAGSMRYPDVIHVSGDIYAFSSLVKGQECRVQLMEVDSAGTIQNISLNYTTIWSSTCNVYPSIEHIAGSSYVVLHSDFDTDLIVTTINITASNTVEILQQQEFVGASNYYANLQKVNDTTFIAIGNDAQADIVLQSFNAYENGSISSSLIDTEEVNTATLQQPHSLMLHNDILVVVEGGDGNDGYIRTFTIASDGSISTVVDELEFDTDQGAEANLINISDSMVAIAYRGTGNDGFLVSVNVSSNGSLSSVIDSIEFDTEALNYPELFHAAPDVVGIWYSGPGNDGFVSTVEVYANGTFGADLGRQEFEVTDTLEKSVVALDSNTLLSLNYESANGGTYAMTTDFTPLGAVDTLVVDESFIAGAAATFVRAIQISDTQVAAVYRGLQNNGYVKTFSISSDGTEINTTDSLILETNGFVNPTFKLFDTGRAVVAYTGPGNDGWMVTLSFAGDGTITQLDKAEYDTTESSDPYLLAINATAVIISDYDNLGGGTFASRLRTYAIASDGTITTAALDEVTITSDILEDSNVVRMNDSHYVVAYRSLGNDGYLQSFEIDELGVISPLANTTFDLSNGYNPNLVRLDGDSFALAYRGQSSDGFLLTYTLGVNASSFSLNDFYEFDTVAAFTPYLFSVRGDRYGIVYETSGNIGQVITLNMSGTGTIDESTQDSFVIGSIGVLNPELFLMTNDVFVGSYYDNGGNGYLQSIDINYNNPPEVLLSSPANEQIFSSTNNVSFLVDVTDDFSLNSCTLYTNVSGSFASNASTLLTGTSNTTAYQLTNVSDGTYLWNTQCCDGEGECSFAQNNQSFSVTFEASGTDVLAPNVTAVAVPPGSNLNVSQSYIFTCDANDNTAVQNVSLFLTNAMNTSLTRNLTQNVSGTAVQANFSVSFSELGSYSFQCQASDPSGNLNDTTSLVSFNVVQPTVSLTSCGVLDSAAVIYTLDNDVHANGTCFTINASDITFRGNGNQINFSSQDSSSYAFEATDVSGLQIYNVDMYADLDTNDVTDSYAVHFVNVSNFDIQNTTIDVLGRNPGLNTGDTTSSRIFSVIDSSQGTIINSTISHNFDEDHLGLYTLNSQDILYEDIYYTYNYRRNTAVYEQNSQDIVYRDFIIEDTGSTRYNDDLISVYITGSNRTTFDGLQLTTLEATRQITQYTTTGYDSFQPILFQNVGDAVITDLNLTSDENSAFLIEGTTSNHYNFTFNGTNTVNGKPLLYIGNQQGQSFVADDVGFVLIANSQNIDLPNANISDGGLSIVNSQGVTVTNMQQEQNAGVPLIYVYKSSGILFDTVDAAINVSGFGSGFDELYVVYESDDITLRDMQVAAGINYDHLFDIRSTNDFTIEGLVTDGVAELFNLFIVDGFVLDDIEMNNVLSAVNEEVFIANEVFNVAINNITIDNPGSGRSSIFYINGNAYNWTVSDFNLSNSNPGSGGTGQNLPYVINLDNDRVYDMFFINGSLSSLNYAEIYAPADIDALSNMTFQSVLFPDAGSEILAPDFTLYRDWLLSVQVNDSLSGSSLPLATVTVNASDGDFITQETTDENGQIFTVVREYVQNSTGFDYVGYNNYTVRATKEFTNVTSINVSEDTTAYLSMPAVDFPPEVSLVAPAHETTFVSFLQNVTLQASVTDDVNVTSCTSYHNISGTFVANETQLIGQQFSTVNFTLTNISSVEVLWNVACTDSAGNTSFAPQNFTFFVENPNSPPTQGVPSLDAASVDFLNSDDLFCTPSGLNDVDGDAIGTTVLWSVDDTSFAYAQYSLGPLGNSSEAQDAQGVHTASVSGASYTQGLDDFGGYSFDGDNDVLDFSNLNYLSDGDAGEYTIFMRVYFDAVNSRFLFGDETSNNGGVLFQTSATGQLQTYVANNFRTSSFTVSAGQWYDLVFRQDSNSIDLFVDGNFEQIITAFTHQETSDTSYAGAYEGNLRDFAGDMSEIIIYAHSLSDEHIAFLSNNRTALANQETSPAETWSCEVLVYDDEDLGITRQSNNLTVEADYDFIAVSVLPNETNFVEGETYTVTSRLNSTSIINATNVNITTTVEFFNGTWQLVSTNNYTVAFWERNTTQEFAVNLTLPVGVTRVSTEVDTDNIFAESLESDNVLRRNLSVSGWATFYGNITNSYVGLSTAQNTTFKEWAINPSGYLLYSDTEANYFPFNLGVFSETNDFNESQTALGLQHVEDSITSLYDANSDGTADDTIVISVAGVDLTVPVARSTNSTSAFYTGILYDTADGIPYDGTQDLVFVSVVDAAQIGGFGQYDYEVRVPYRLGEQVGAVDDIASLYGLD